eukprot:2649795-Rhodomonas_salina.1
MTSIQPPSTNTTNPEWNEQFDLEVQDASQSQLEVTLWQVEWKTQLDSTEERPVNNSNFLGEVIINVSKLVPFAGNEVQQYFAVKTIPAPKTASRAQGKSVQIEHEATGQLMLTLKYLTPELAALPGAKKVRLTSRHDRISTHVLASRDLHRVFCIGLRKCKHNNNTAFSCERTLLLLTPIVHARLQPRYSEFELQAAADIVTILDLPAGSPRIEVVGCQRWVDDKQQQRGTQLHVNLHPSSSDSEGSEGNSSDQRSVKDLKEGMLAALREKSAKLAASSVLSRTVDINMSLFLSPSLSSRSCALSTDTCLSRDVDAATSRTRRACRSRAPLCRQRRRSQSRQRLRCISRSRVGSERLDHNRS